MRLDRAIVRASAAAVLLAIAVFGVQVAAQPAPQIIKISAKKFEYQPSEIKLKKGVPVILELTSADVVMGFNAVDFGMRADVIPGKVARVRIVPDKTGVFTFFCDIFCGSGHEEMSGTITVVD